MWITLFQSKEKTSVAYMYLGICKCFRQTLIWLSPINSKGVKAALCIGLLALLIGCTPGSILKGALGGGPNVAANTQVGKENTQTIGNSTRQTFGANNISVVPQESSSLRPQGRPVSTPKVEQIQNQTNNELPTWAWILFIVLFVVGWVTDTPATFFKNLRK